MRVKLRTAQPAEIPYSEVEPGEYFMFQEHFGTNLNGYIGIRGSESAFTWFHNGYTCQQTGRDDPVEVYIVEPYAVEDGVILFRPKDTPKE